MEMAKTVMVWTQSESAMAEDRMKMEAGTKVALVEQQTQVKMVEVKTKSMRAGEREGASEAYGLVDVQAYGDIVYVGETHQFSGIEVLKLVRTSDGLASRPAIQCACNGHAQAQSSTTDHRCLQCSMQGWKLVVQVQRSSHGNTQTVLAQNNKILVNKMATAGRFQRQILLTRGRRKTAL
jgi:hypothetical protein